MKTIHFNKAKELGRNPFMGFTSFQHFNGELLYSDIVVRPENNMTETENVECYPIPEDVPQNGRKEGFYPDCDIAYFRILWKEFEPTQGVYNYKLIEDLIKQAKKHHQRILFRLLPHSTRARDDVPDWLKKLIDCPERPDGKRVKDSPTDPLFLVLFEEAIRKLGEHFDNDPVFYCVDICLPGAWGEGYKLERYKDEDIKQLVDTFVESFPNTHLVAQLGLPWLVNYLNEKKPVGYRGDGCGNGKHMEVIYPREIGQLNPDLWKKAPVSFEAYWWLGEWQRHEWNIDAIIEKTLEWHVSCFNAKSIPIPYDWKDKIDYWLSKMGYHLYLSDFSFPETAGSGDTLSFGLRMNNRGVAPLYEDIPVLLRIKNESKSIILDTGLKPVDWLPGVTDNSFSIVLPFDMKSGTYDIEIGMITKEGDPIYLCSDILFDENFYRLGNIEII